MTRRKTRLVFEQPRELLLTEIARRCRACDAPARVGLTKAEARDYAGFECEACDEWNEDDLSERDIPEWWEELRVTGLDSLRPRAGEHADSDESESDSVKRLSDAWGAFVLEGGTAAEDSSDDGAESSSRDRAKGSSGGMSGGSARGSSSGGSSEDSF